MALKLLIIVVVFYFVARSVVNMVRAILDDPKAQPRVPPHPRPGRGAPGQGPSRSTQRGRAEVEDARWVDLD